MKDLLAANRYAQALFDIARLLHKDEEIEAELEAFSDALKRSPEIEKFLHDPRLKINEKKKFVQRIYQERRHEIYKALLNFFMILFRKNRFNLIHEIAVSFKRIADEAQGQGVAEITTAAPLGKHEEERIVERLEKMAGYKIAVKKKEIDPSLIGGLLVRVKNRVIDGSVKHQVDILRKELIRIRHI